MHLHHIAERYLTRFNAVHGAACTGEQRSALNAILGCRTAQYGELSLRCTECATSRLAHPSCGHRSCNRCQNHTASQWLERQRAKLLPVEYFMVTFTLPRELRTLAKNQPRCVHSLLFECAVATLNTFASNDSRIASTLAMTAVLHTHNRRLDDHPHVHLIVPGGTLDKQRRHWVPMKGKYLFNGKALAKVFRAIFLRALERQGLACQTTPHKWVAHCKHVGRGLPAFKYLSRYLYRGVISNRNIIHDDGTFVTFRYTEGRSRKTRTRRLRGEDFIALVLQHTLPKGFRRARDYGFLHGNARRPLILIQWRLNILVVSPPTKHKPPPFLCQRCNSVMAIVDVNRAHRPPG